MGSSWKKLMMNRRGYPGGDRVVVWSIPESDSLQLFEKIYKSQSKFHSLSSTSASQSVEEQHRVFKSERNMDELVISQKVSVLRD
ncbi:hypothetical protein DY000_02053763 [Brassica cretica]|uniref:Uncharacterized protein n=1 Tax=Brassica cretica TaxID=69181 RepID=A0ABQ7AA57_BRACR|nr:hypothetical protein DY000_02053763 [Brassica cretica]